MRLFRRLLLVFMVLAAIALILVVMYVRGKRPPLQAKTEIFRGVFYECVNLPSHLPGRGRVMIVEVQLLVPGVEVLLRPFDEAAPGEEPLYQLTFADTALRRGDLQVLMNGVLYEQAEWWQSIPGLSKRPHETVVVDGTPSHQHEHSYLLWCDDRSIVTMETTKPPSEYALANAVWALGMQGVAVRDGRVSAHLQEHGSPAVLPITFIGIDPRRSVLWLIAFEETSQLGMAQFAADLGVRDGGMLDSGASTSLIIGEGARGVAPYTGIRGARPLASWVGIRATPADTWR